MSKHRIKAVAQDDDDFADYDDYYEEEEDDDGLTPENRELLGMGTLAVRAELEEGFPATDKEIQDTLWNYYYDISRTVTYLKNKQSTASPRITRKQGRTSATTTRSPEQFNARDFFEGVPWLCIALSQQARITCQPRGRAGGLLGGSMQGGKMSKVAALAAKRRQKEDAQPSQAGQIDSATTDTRVSSLEALRISSPAPPQNKDKDITNQAPVDTAATTKASMCHDSEAHLPGKAEVGTADLQTSGAHLELTELAARPSSFAGTIFGAGIQAQSSYVASTVEHTLLRDQTPGFDFTAPSPDDIVTKAQAAKAEQEAVWVPELPKMRKVDLSNGVSMLSLVQEPEKTKTKMVDVIAEYGKVKGKKAANFVVIGHVDAGKSTLMGRLLFDLKAIDQRTMDKYKREAENIGKGSFAFAWILDHGSEERARGVTIDIAMNNFETENTRYTILDAPGHRDFVPNMIAGASQADFAVLVIDASTGNFESGLKGQTREHALLVRAIGVQRIIVAVNKMDAVSWSEVRFAEIQQQMSAFLATAGFQPKNVSFVPCSGLQGDNILHKSKDEKVSWYHGLSLVEELDKSEPTMHVLNKPLRVTIGDVFRGTLPSPVSVSGRLEAGTVQIGEQVLIMPSGEKASIRTLEVDDEGREWAVAGQNVVLHLKDIDPIHLKTGDVLCSSVSPIQNVTQFTAKVLAFDHLTPMNVVIHRGRLNVPGRLSQLVATLDKASGAVVKKRPKIVPPGTVVRVVVTLDQPVPLESPGRIVLRNGGETVGTGLIE